MQSLAKKRSLQFAARKTEKESPFELIRKEFGRSSPFRAGIEPPIAPESKASGPVILYSELVQDVHDKVRITGIEKLAYHFYYIMTAEMLPQ